MRHIAALALALAFVVSPAGAAAQTLAAGDKLVYETVAAFGFESMPQMVRDPVSIETRLTLGVASVDPSGMDVDVEIAVGVRAIRYRGPSFTWAIEPATPDGFVARALAPREAEELTEALLPRSLPPLALELVRRELSLAVTVASLHGRHAQARVSCGPEPFVRLEQLDVPAFSRSQNLMAERYLRTALLLAFPPVPLDLRRDAERYEAGGARYEIVGHRDAIWPIRGREHRIRALEASSAARAAFAFEAVNDTGLEPDPRGPRVREWGDVHAHLGIAGRRHIRVVSTLASRPDGGGEGPEEPEEVKAVASWHAELVRARQERPGGRVVAQGSAR